MPNRIALVVTGLALPLSAWAQSNSADTAITTAPVEISESRLPASATTRSTYDLSDNAGVSVDTTDLSSKAANFYVGTSGARSFTDTFALRGLTNTPIFGDPAVTVYLDDLPLAGGFTFPSGLVGFTGADLYRGPEQNTLFGRAGTVGVLRFTTPAVGAPDNRDLRAYFGNYDARGLMLRDESRPSEDTDVYAAFGYEARRGYIYNTTLNQDIDGRESTSALARVRYNAGNNGSWTLLLSGQRVRDGVQPLVPLEGPKFEVSRGEEGVTHLQDWGASLRGAFQTSLGEVSETTSYSNWKLGPATNALDFGFALLEDGSDLKQSSWSEELKLVQVKGENWRGAFGAFAGHDRTEGAFIRAFSGQVFEESDYRINHDELAVFGEASFDLAPGFTLTPGLRAEGNWKKMNRREIVPGSDVFDRKANSGAVLPKLAASYKVDASTEASLAFGTGYKPGGFSSFTGNPALAKFDPERLAGIDAALTSAQQGRWSVTWRGFAYWIHGYQIERSFHTGAEADDYLVVNAPRARSVGTELEFSFTPVRDWSVGVDLGLTNITLREFRDPYTGVVYNGKRAPYAPLFTGMIFVEYHQAKGWFGRVEGVETGRTFYTEGEDPTFSQGSYGLLNAKIGYEHERYRVCVYGDNLTDQEYFSAITPGTFHGTPGAPRTYGVEFDTKF